MHAKPQQGKRAFVIPELTVHGDAIDITRNGSLPNADTPAGANGTAFSPSKPGL